jgi:hypothetical protein
MATHATKCLSLVKGRRIRVTQLDGCGRPVYGDDSQVVSKGFISVAFTANTTESDEINVTNAAGEVCVFEAAVTSLTGYGLEIQFCEVDPELFALVTGQPVVIGADGSTVIGFDVDTKVSLDNSNFALELWAGSPAGDACSTEGAQGAFGYLLLPYLTGGILGDFTVENGAVTFTLTGANTKEGNSWGSWTRASRRSPTLPQCRPAWSSPSRRLPLRPVRSGGTSATERGTTWPLPATPATPTPPLAPTR